MGWKGTGRNRKDLVRIWITKSLRDKLINMKKISRKKLKNYDDVINHFYNFFKRRIAHGK
ncbi:hypothetical protein CCP1ISM_60022 [Azospirillaceae bacterium]